MGKGNKPPNQGVIRYKSSTGRNCAAHFTLHLVRPIWGDHLGCTERKRLNSEWSSGPVTRQFWQVRTRNRDGGLPCSAMKVRKGNTAVSRISTVHPSGCGTPGGQVTSMESCRRRRVRVTVLCAIEPQYTLRMASSRWGNACCSN